MAVLAEAAVTGILLPQIGPLGAASPVMLVLAGALLHRVTLALAVALSIVDLTVVQIIGHRPLTKTLALGTVYCGAAGCGWALRWWWASASPTTVAAITRGGDVAAIGHAQAGFGALPSRQREAAHDLQLALLSPREREVAALAVEGLNSRDIGIQLFISQRTVETHLANVYDKLEIHSRSALIARLERGQAGGPHARPRNHDAESPRSAQR